MPNRNDAPVRDLEVMEELGATEAPEEAFLHLRRLRCRNVREDGTTSALYRVDVVDRPRLDAVAVVLYRRGEAGVEVLTRMNLRPAAYFRKGRAMAVPDPGPHLFVEEIVAGLLEPQDQGEAGIRARAAAEAKEEAGFAVSPDEVTLLGGPFFVAPGILSEKIHLCAADVTGMPQGDPVGDGTPLEEGGRTRWWSLPALRKACESGEIQDAKTELGAHRLLVKLG